MLSFNAQTKKITGYYENSTGWDEVLKIPRFSCVFFFEGDFKGDSVVLKTYYPYENIEEIIWGSLNIIDNKTVGIKLKNEHGGCFNVLHLSENAIEFKLQEQKNWSEINYISSNKAYFHKDKNNATKTKSYLIKGDFVCINKIESNWAYCNFYGNKFSTGWIKLSDINRF
jgi:hypothetical protein